MGRPALYVARSCVAPQAVISMQFPGVEDFIIHGATGFVANTESEFAGILTHLAENPVLRQEIGLRAFQSNGNFFDIAKMIRRIGRLLWVFGIQVFSQ